MRSWSSEEIRKTFLDYFASKGHEVVKSSSLVPEDDPTLLFTNAGMVQFKKIFLQQEKRPYKRATSCQKCMRAGGKHNDLENVGRTLRHHTFFEMLGNFSFGDYFKKEAIEMAWELLTEVFGLNKGELWVTVHRDDEESRRLWKELIGVPEERIVGLGDEDNFWAMGDTGPCGPCSEIIIDQGEGVGCGRPDCGPWCECDRFLELWNLVFMQYERTPEGELRPLPRPCIDTGMGLERITAVLQGVKGNYDTDLFSPIISRIEELSGVAYGEDPTSDVSIRVIADHARAVAFLIADGVLPSNEGRGYVLRRIIRRALRHGHLLGLKGPFLTKVIEKVREKMSKVYPELEFNRKLIDEVCLREEERFSFTLERGLELLYEEMQKLKERGQQVLPGDLVFKLYDTYGFPLDLIEEISRDEGFEVDRVGYGERMAEQRERGRASWKGTLVRKEGILQLEGVETVFVGYESLEAESEALALLKDGELVDEAVEGEEIEVLTRLTPFYPEGGGQMGDKGVIDGEGVVLEVIDTRRVSPSLITHRSLVKRGKLKVGTSLRLKVDPYHRAATARNHTATHILHAVLRELLGGHVKQAGSLVEPKRLRFDFTHFAPLDEAILKEVEVRVNRIILMDLPVKVEYLPLEEALRKGALALFGEKYGETVRLVEVEGVSRELCGGTHVRHTGEIGLFKVLSEGAVASGVRRIEAVTGEEVLQWIFRLEEDLKEVSELLGLKAQKAFAEATREGIKRRIRQLKEELLGLEEELKNLQRQLTTGLPSGVSVKELKGIKVACAKMEGLDHEALRELGDHIRETIGSGIVAVASVKDNKGLVVLMVTKDLSDRLNASSLLKEAISSLGGKGGGKDTLAQGSLPPSLLEGFFTNLEEVLRKGVSSS